MLPITSLKLLSALAIFFITLFAGSYPFIKKAKSLKALDFPIGEALACGVFLGAGLIHMLGDATNIFSRNGIKYPLAFLITGATFLILLWLEHLGRELYHHEGEQAPGFAILAVIMLSIHSFLAGAALGISSDLSVFIVILMAILAHKWAASFALSIQINKSNLSAKIGLTAFMIFAIMTPIGIILGHWFAQSVHTMPLLPATFSALAAGTFLYMGTLHGLSRAVMVKQCCDLKNFSFVILGFALMAIVAIWT